VDRVGRTGTSCSYFVHGCRNGILSRFRFTELKDFGLRLIAIDRPGLGDSDYVPKKSLISWSKDVQSLMEIEHLKKHETFPVGFSLGAPFALILAAQKLVSKVALVSGLDDFSDTSTRQLLSADFQNFVLQFQSRKIVEKLLCPI
jgi:pimeloyl-ACP methyl ester carboxylesterase